MVRVFVRRAASLFFDIEVANDALSSVLCCLLHTPRHLSGQRRLSELSTLIDSDVPAKRGANHPAGISLERPSSPEGYLVEGLDLFTG